MPKVYLAIPETEHSIVRPIVLEVARRLMDLTGIMKENTAIVYPSELMKLAQQGSTILPGSSTPNNLPFSDRVTIEVTEEPQEARLSSTAIDRPENRVIFFDDRVDTIIRPVFAMTDVTMTFSFRAKDKATSERWRSGIRMRVSAGEEYHMHSISYSYAIPGEFELILQEIHRLRENVAGYGETYDEWFADNSTDRISELTTLIGTGGRKAVAETQIRIPGYFDFTAMPEKGDREDGGEAWTCSFTYKFSYDKALGMQITFPLVVHNQVIKFHDTNETSPQYARSYTESSYYFAHFEAEQNLSGQVEMQRGLSIPNWDEFVPVYTYPDTVNVLSILTTIDDANPSLLMNVKELGDVTIIPSVLAFLLSEAPYVTQLYASIFSIVLYRNRELLAPNTITLNSAGDINATGVLSLRDYYHIRFSLVSDITKLSQAALNRLREHTTAFIAILGVIDPTLTDMPEILSGDFMSRAELEKLMWRWKNHPRKMVGTVQNLFIKTVK